MARQPDAPDFYAALRESALIDSDRAIFAALSERLTAPDAHGHHVLPCEPAGSAS